MQFCQDGDGDVYLLNLCERERVALVSLIKNRLERTAWALLINI